MTRLRGPGCLLRGALAVFGIALLPIAFWFGYRDLGKYWVQALAVVLLSAVFLRLALSKDENSWLAIIDELQRSKKR